MFAQTTEVLDFRSFCRGEKVLLYKEGRKRKKMYKTVLKVGVLTVTILTLAPLPIEAHSAITTLAATAPAQTEPWQHLVDKLMELLDPLAKIFMIIAGTAIMTGNGRIGLERMFWLSIGYLTCRHAQDWIAFLKTV